MKPHQIAVGLLVIAIALLVAVRKLAGTGESSQVPREHEIRSAESTGSRRHKNAGAESSSPSIRLRVPESEKGLRGHGGRRELPGIASAIQEQPGSDARGLFGVSIDGEIDLGETLVIGGNLRPDGSHEFTLITPKIVKFPDGRQGAEVDVRVIEAGSRFIEENGLQSIGANAQSALQVAEAWRPHRTKQVVERLSQLEDSAMLSAPKVVAMLGQAFAIRVGDEDGSSYTLHGTLSLADSGALRIQSRLERSIQPNLKDSIGAEP